MKQSHCFMVSLYYETATRVENLQVYTPFAEPDMFGLVTRNMLIWEP